jgi:hypothetical protein
MERLNKRKRLLGKKNNYDNNHVVNAKRRIENFDYWNNGSQISHQEEKLVVETSPAIDTMESLISNRELSVFSSLEFSKNAEPVYVAVEEACSYLAVIGNVNLVEISHIAIEYGQNTENRRKQLYKDFMFEIKKMLSNEHYLVTYEDWSRCFNAIFTNILVGKLQQCSSYKRGKESLVGFRGRVLNSKSDTLALTTFYNETKKAATHDVKDIMKILHLVLKDSCQVDPNDVDVLQLKCTENYSSLYLKSSLEHDFQTFVIEQQLPSCSSFQGSNNNASVTSLQQMYAATAPETILLDTSHKNYKDTQVNVSY